MPDSPRDILTSFDERLASIDVTRPQRRRLSVKAVMLILGTILIVVLLPFLALVRLASLFYLRWSFPPWPALLTAAAITVGIVAVYAAWLSRKLTGRARFGMMGKWVALPLVAAYCGYSLLYVADANTKTSKVREYYRTLHPIVRVALSTFILADDDLVITDIARTPADYVAMDLPVRDASHHYRQRDGYVHAIDLRTIGRPQWRNWITQQYFRTMGFRTLRHVGTADHLHVGLDVK